MINIKKAELLRRAYQIHVFLYFIYTLNMIIRSNLQLITDWSGLNFCYTTTPHILGMVVPATKGTRVRRRWTNALLYQATAAATITTSSLSTHFFICSLHRNPWDKPSALNQHQVCTANQTYACWVTHFPFVLWRPLLKSILFCVVEYAWKEKKRKESACYKRD